MVIKPVRSLRTRTGLLGIGDFHCTVLCSANEDNAFPVKPMDGR